MSVVQAQRIPTGTWKADPIHSSVGFEIDHSGVSTFRGAFKQFEATVEVTEDALTIEGVAPVEAVTIDEENLRGHLLSPDFFDAERHPEIRFRSTGVREDGGELVVDGELTIRGETKQVEARGSGRTGLDIQGNERVGLKLETTVDRTEFGLNWQAELPSGGKVLGDEVRIVVELELIKA